MDAAPALSSSLTAIEHAAPYLPPSTPRPAPPFEPRVVELDLAVTHQAPRTPRRGYLVGIAGLAVASAVGWFAFGAYIYG